MKMVESRQSMDLSSGFRGVGVGPLHYDRTRIEAGRCLDYRHDSVGDVREGTLEVVVTVGMRQGSDKNPFWGARVCLIL